MEMKLSMLVMHMDQAKGTSNEEQEKQRKNVSFKSQWQSNYQSDKDPIKNVARPLYWKLQAYWSVFSRAYEKA